MPIIGAHNNPDTIDKKLIALKEDHLTSYQLRKDRLERVLTKFKKIEEKTLDRLIERIAAVENMLCDPTFNVTTQMRLYIDLANQVEDLLDKQEKTRETLIASANILLSTPAAEEQVPANVTSPEMQKVAEKFLMALAKRSAEKALEKANDG